jgi:hypothetical protein
MPVASSSYAVDPVVQVDGRRYVLETHTLTSGEQVRVDYLAPAGADYDAVMAARVPLINAGFASREYNELVERNGWSIGEQTAAELAARFRAEYQGAERFRACQMAYWLLERIAAGNFTDAQARNAFGLTTTQWNTLKSTRLQPQHDAWAAVLAATGA